MNIVNELKEISLLKNGDIDYLQKSDLPLVLYGAGQLSSLVKCFLNRNNIKIDFVIVDRKYWQPNTKFHDLEALQLEDVLANNSKINVILAFASGKYALVIEKTAELSKLQNVNKCLFFDVLQDFVFDFVDRHSIVLVDLYNNLADDLSRRIMFEFMKARNLTNAKDLIKLNVEKEEQYFPDFLCLSDNETFVDCGAFTAKDKLKI